MLNQKGIDPPSLEIKRRNIERLTLACGGNAVNSIDDLCEDDLGYADTVYEEILEDDKYTFVEGVRNQYSCTCVRETTLRKGDYAVGARKRRLRCGSYVRDMGFSPHRCGG